MTVRKAIIILILGISVLSNAEAAQIVIDSAASYGEASMTLVTPQEQFQAIDDNFDELYGFWATIDTEAEFKELYNLEAGVDFYSVSAIDTMLGDYVLTSALTTALGDYVLTSALTTALGDYVLTSALTTALGDYVLTSALATATVQTAGELSPTKESGVAGFFELFEEDTTNELVWGWRGPSDLSVNISNMPPDAAGAVGQALVISNVQTSQTLESGKTGTLVTYTNTTVVPTDDGYGAGWNGDTTEIPSKDDIYDKIESLSMGSGAPSFVTSDPSVTDTSGLYINTTDGDMFAVNQNTGISTWATTYTPWWLLTVSDAGNSNVISSDGTIDCGDDATDCTQYLVNNATPTLTATAASGYEFLNWTGDATDTSTTTNPDTITIDSAKTIGAIFNLLPTILSTVLEADGQTFTLTGSENLNTGVSGIGGFVVTGSTTGADDLVYSSGDGTDTYIFTAADQTFIAGETVTLAYTQPGDGMEDDDGGDMASFSDASVTNNSEQSSESSPIAFFKFESPYNTTESYDEITDTGIGSGADTVAYVTGQDGNMIQSDAVGEGIILPAESLIGSAVFTISGYFEVSGNAQNNFVISYDNTGDTLTFQPYYAGGLGYLTIRTSYTSYTFTFTATSISVIHSFKIIGDFANSTAANRVKLWIDGTPIDTSGVDMSGMVDWGTLSGNMTICRLATETGHNISVDELKFYSTAVPE
jgi:hypothetical protein